MEDFNSWQEAHNHLIRKMIYGSPDFLWGENGGCAEWMWVVEDWVTKEDTAPYNLVTFEGDCMQRQCPLMVIAKAMIRYIKASVAGLKTAASPWTSALVTEPCATC